MIVFIFDGSFEGFLTCIYNSYYGKVKPDIIESNIKFQGSLVDTSFFIETDFEKANKVYFALKNKVSDTTFQDIYYTFLSSEPENFTMLYKFIKLAFSIGSAISFHLQNPIVLYVINTSKKVFGEAHRFLGFVRFKEAYENLYYSKIEPDNNILPIISSHFVDRFTNQNFVIYDSKRKIALVYNTEDYIISDIEDSFLHKLINNKENDHYEILFKAFVTAVSIKERSNPKLQSSHAPKRYLKNIFELRHMKENNK